MPRLIPRNQVPEALTWDLTHIFPSRAAWEAELSQAEADLAALEPFRGRLGAGPAVLLECLSTWDSLEGRCVRAIAYGEMHLSADGTSEDARSMATQSAKLRAAQARAAAFIEPELTRLPAGTLERYLSEEPGLAPYRTFLRSIAAKVPHTLSPEAEQAVAALHGALQTPNTIYERIIFSDAKFQPVDDRDGQPYQVGPDIGYRTTGRIPDAATRRRAAESLAAGLDKHKNAMAAAVAAYVNNHVALARLRGYASAEAMMLHEEQAEVPVYATLLETVRRELPAHVQRLARLRMKVTGQPQVYLHDLWAPLDTDPVPPLSPEDGARLITAALAPLGPEYGRILARAFGERWIDWADNVGKPAVQYARPVAGVHPYVITAWQSTYANARGLAHELGHVAHTVFSEENQSYRTGMGGWFFVEAPSTANELFVGYHVLETATSPRMEREGLHLLLTTYHGMFVLLGAMADFTSRCYAEAEAGRPLTAGRLMALQEEVYRHYFGETLEINQGVRLEWMLWPQLFMNLHFKNYMVGLTCAFQAVQAIRKEGEPAVQRWLAVHKAGGSRPPLELMRSVGADLADPQTIVACLNEFSRLIGELERHYN